MSKYPDDKIFYGTATLGEKGQVVIPAEARRALKLEKGEKLLVLGFDNEMIAITKIENLQKFANHLSNKLKKVSEMIEKSK